MWCSDVVVLVSLMVSCGVMDGGRVGCEALMGAGSGSGGFFYFVFLYIVVFFNVILIFVYIILMYIIEE